MTTQAIASRRTVIAPHEESSEHRTPGVYGLLATPGLLKLCISNGLSQSFAMRLQGIAVAWVVLELTDSRLWLGIVNGVPALSIVVFSLLGGVLSDTQDSRRLLIGVRSVQAALTFFLAVLVTAGQIQAVHLLLYVLLAVGLSAVDMPLARTRLHQVAGSPRLLSATAAQAVAMNLVNIVAPVSMGFLIGMAGPSAGLAMLSVGYVLAAGLLVSTAGGAATAGHRPRPIEDMLAGLAYIRSTPTLGALVSLAFLVPLAGVYFAMVPVYARDVLHVGVSGLGILVASFGFGSLIGAAHLTLRQQVRGRGSKVAVLGVLFGAGMVGFGLSSSFVLSCGISFLLGLMAAFWQNILSALIQVVAAPEMRGRAISIFTMGFQLASLGWLVGGVGASLASPQLVVALAGTAFAGLSSLVFLRCREAREFD